MGHADSPAFKVHKVLTTDAAGKSVSANDLRLGDKIRIVVRVSVTLNGPPRIVGVTTNNAPKLKVHVNGSQEELTLVYPLTSSTSKTENLVDYPNLPSADKDSDTNTGDVVFVKTIQASDRITSFDITRNDGMGIDKLTGHFRFRDQGNALAFNLNVAFADGVVDALAAIRADGSLVRPPPLPPVDEPVEPVEKPKRRKIIFQCPVGWQRSDGFAGRNRRVLLYEVKLEMDLQNRVSIYKPVWVAIYVHPDEGLENLEGWKLHVALPYNQHREYPLTAENSVVVDAGFVEGGFAFIENPEEDPFPMVGIGFTGAPAPGFDYRLYDETGKRVDFGISCYKRGDIFQVLRNMEDPRVLRKVSLKDIDWNASWFIRSEWTAPVPVNGFPGAPSLQRGNLVGTWADLKKQ